MSVPYTIISTGSVGNAVIVNKSVLIDCGVCFKMLKPYYRDLKIVLLTHIHTDHFNATAIRLLADERPMLRFACGKWLVKPLLDCGVRKSNIDVLDSNICYNYGMCNIIQFPLSHDVPNCGYKIHFPVGKVFYATDTNNLNGISARNYELYLIEANYIDEEIQEKIRQKEENGEFVYEKRVLRTHLSKAKCDDFIYSNMGGQSEYVYLHCHRDKENV